jgi:hypothetical protein
MPHIHWVARQNKLEIPRDKDEVKQREIRESDGQAHDPDTIFLFFSRWLFSKVKFIYIFIFFIFFSLQGTMRNCVQQQKEQHGGG